MKRAYFNYDDYKLRQIGELYLLANIRSNDLLNISKDLADVFLKSKEIDILHAFEKWCIDNNENFDSDFFELIDCLIDSGVAEYVDL